MTCLHSLVAALIETHFSEPAVIFDNGEEYEDTISYKQLWERASAIQADMLRVGVENQCVAVMLENDINLPCVLLGLLLNHCPFYPMSGLSGGLYNAEVLKAVGASYIVVHEDLAQALIQALESFQYEEKITPNLQRFKLRLYRVQSLVNKDHSCESLPRDADIAYCITTSGTTSKPKVVRVSHACIVPNIKHLNKIFQLRPGDRVLLTSPLTFDPSIVDIFCTLSSGACLVIIPSELKRRPEKLLNLLHERQKVTVIQATPSLLRSFSQGRLAETVLGQRSHLRVLALGGEQFPSAVELRDWIHPDNRTCLYNLYGITEVSCWASCQLIDKHAVLNKNAVVSIGKALDKTLVKLSPAVDLDKHETAFAHQRYNTGLILIGSSERVCHIDGEDPPGCGEMVWRSTGDIGYPGPDGDIIYLGRSDTQIKRLGKRMDLSSVEQVITGLPEVSSCCVLYHRSCLAAFVVVSDTLELLPGGDETVHSSPEPSDLRSSRLKQQTTLGATKAWSTLERTLKEKVTQRLPRHAVPDIYMEMVGGFPMTSHGKLDQKALKSILDVRLDGAANNPSLQSPLNLVKEHLPASTDNICGCSNFISMGGDSLSAVRLATALQAMNPSLDMAHIFDVLVNQDLQAVLACVRVELGSTPQLQFCEKCGTSERIQITEKCRFSEYDPIQPSAKYQKLGSQQIGEINHAEKAETKHGAQAHLKNDVYEDNSTLEKTSTKSSLGNEEINVNKSHATGAVAHFSNNKSDIGSHDSSINGISNTHNLEQNPRLRKGHPNDRDCSRARKVIQRGGRIVQARLSVDCSMTECWNGAVPDYDSQAGLSCPRDAQSRNLQGVSPEIVYGNRRKSLEIYERWRFNTHKCVDASPLVVEYWNQAAVFVGSHSGRLSRLDLASGACAWTTHLPDRVESSACCTRDGKSIVVGCYDGSIYTLSSDSGDVLWCYPTADTVKCSPTLDPATGHILCGSHDGKLYCLDVENHQCKWQRHLGGGSVFATPWVDSSEDMVFASTLGGLVVSLCKLTGQVKWKRNLKKPVFASPCVYKQCLAVGCVDCTMYCLATHSGDVIWTFRAGGPIFSSPVVYGNYVFFGCHDCHVYCLSTDGQLQWRYKTGATVYATVFPFRLKMNNPTHNEQNLNEIAAENLKVNISEGIHDSSENNMVSKASLDLTSSEYEFSHTKSGSRRDEICKAISIDDTCYKELRNEKQVATKCSNFDNSFETDDKLPKDSSDSGSDLRNHLLTSGKVTQKDFRLSDVVKPVRESTEDCVLATSTEGRLVILRIADGCGLGDFVLPGQVFSSSIILGSQIVVGCRDNNVYCLGIT